MVSAPQHHQHGSGAHHHDWQSPGYVADWIARDVTRDAQRRPLLVRMAGLIAGDTDAPVRVLDVGGGYGAVSSAVLDTLPQASVVWQDYSPAMLAQARTRLAGYAGRVEFCLADLTDPGWVVQVGGPFDAVVSALAIHNLFDADVIARVYRDVYTLLRPGGCFLNAELVFPAGELLAGLYERDPARDPDQAVRAVASGGLAQHLAWLSRAGFAEVDCLVKDRQNALLCGLRAR